MIPLLILFLLAWPEVSFGYLQPDSGYLLWQIILAGVVGTALTAKTAANAFRGFVRRLMGRA